MATSTKIDLKSRRLDKEKKVQTGSVSLPVYLLDEKTLDEMARLADVFERVGISLNIERYENTGLTSSYDMLRIKVNEEQYKKVTTRHAGRKQNFIEMHEKYKACTVAELKEYLDTMTKIKIAALLGCSRMTLYRIIKNIEKYEPEDYMSIWHYTSGK